MASKRVLNRLYWATVKATTGSVTAEAEYARDLYRKALNGVPDRVILDSLNLLEERYGPHRVHVDLANKDLWDARIVVDVIRKSTRLLRFALYVQGGLVETIELVDESFDFDAEAARIGSGGDDDLYEIVLDPSNPKSINWFHVAAKEYAVEWPDE